ENYMIAGWHQWADAGEISSGLPLYLIELTGAVKIGEIDPQGFYLFQIPGTHHLLRPEVKLVDGHRESMSSHRNEFFYSEVNGKGLVIFLGEEPHWNEDRYAGAFLDAVEALHVKRVVIVGGVFGSMPYDKDREVSCVYSLPGMKRELERYACRFSNYQGGSTIGTYLAHRAEFRGIELVVFYAFAPAYEFAQLGITLQAMRVDEDWKAWYDLMRRIDYMFRLGLDLSDLERRAQELVEAWDAKVEEMEREKPELHVRAHLQRISREFEERPFIPLDDAWDELGDLLDDMDEE
ncbi:MAG: PAC2 family protein, partial [Chloroflexi bacterium]|nr:PAC2 family protein [Chloroflexota bacterium]